MCREIVGGLDRDMGGCYGESRVDRNRGCVDRWVTALASSGSREKSEERKRATRVIKG